MSRVIHERAFALDSDESHISIMWGLDLDPNEGRGYALDFEWVLKFNDGYLDILEVPAGALKGVIRFSNVLFKMAFAAQSDQKLTASRVKKILDDFGYYDASAITWSSDGYLQTRRREPSNDHKYEDSDLQNLHCEAEDSGSYQSV